MGLGYRIGILFRLWLENTVNVNTWVDCVRRGVSRKLSETGSVLCKNPTNALIYKVVQI